LLTDSNTDFSIFVVSHAENVVVNPDKSGVTEVDHKKALYATSEVLESPQTTSSCSDLGRSSIQGPEANHCSRDSHGLSANKRPKLDFDRSSLSPITFQGASGIDRSPYLLAHLGDGRRRPGDVLYD